MYNEINDIKEIPEYATTEQLRCRFGTGRAVLTKDAGPRRKEYGYREGCMTELGDIRKDVWLIAVERIIKTQNGQELFESLLRWTEDRIPWAKTRDEQQEYAMDLYLGKMHENKEWLGYEEYQEKYRKG